MTHDLSIWIWWNLKIRLNFLSLCISWHRKLEMFLKCIPMIRIISRLRKTTKNCNYKLHSHRALHVITVTALKLNTALDRCVNSNTRDTSSNKIKSDRTYVSIESVVTSKNLKFGSNVFLGLLLIENVVNTAETTTTNHVSRQHVTISSPAVSDVCKERS